MEKKMKKKMIVGLALCAFFNAGSVFAVEAGVVKEVPTLTVATHYERAADSEYDDVDTPTLSALDIKSEIE
jgi:hypothetical protein